MKYTEIDLQVEDLMWFGIDKNCHTLNSQKSGGTARTYQKNP